MSLFGTAFAQVAPSIGGASKFDFISIVPFLFLIVVGYFLIFRPQQKKMKQHADMIAALRRGDRIVSSSGIIGSIYKVMNNDEIIVEIAENVRVKMLKSSIGQILSKTLIVDVNAGQENDHDDAIENTAHVIDDKNLVQRKNIKPAVRSKKSSLKNE